jgi:hypothetical protein
MALIESIYAHLETIKASHSRIYLATKNFIKFPFQTAVYKNYTLDIVSDLSY